MVPTEAPEDHSPLPGLKAAAIPAVATYKSQKHKAMVFICGAVKKTVRKGDTSGPILEIYIEGLPQLFPFETRELFNGPPDSTRSEKIRLTEISVQKGAATFKARNWVTLAIGDYPASVIPPDQNGNNILMSGLLTKGSGSAAAVQLLQQMSHGFDKGHISIGGTVLVPHLEIDFSGAGAGKVLPQLFAVIGY